MNQQGLANDVGANDHVSDKFYYYTDATGNNHAIVRMILKRRPWLQRIEKISKMD